ncbi:hypothetical protein QYE76_027271 [Lolium multiflorum]|uniref:Uncharacterized protein n=1 Tax=Lolium multiflorum TaxID=4521 RepID=A0AAD8VEC5_LOLMU|nr:hypothetical protein QYE76_027271 [Lolium multiflorum]
MHFHQVLPTIRGARVSGLLDDSDAAPPEMPTEKPGYEDSADQTEKSVPNPAYDAWIARDQIVLGYLLQSIGPEVLPHVHRIETAIGVWQAVEEMFASHCQTKITNLRIQLANTKKLQMSTDAFLTKMQGIVDELATDGKVITTREHVSFILAGLGGSYNSLVAALGVSTAPISLSSLDAGTRTTDREAAVETILIIATRDEMIAVTIARLVKEAVVAVHPPAGVRGRDHGRRRNTPWVDVTCQICDKEGHPAKDCWW